MGGTTAVAASAIAFLPTISRYRTSLQATFTGRVRWNKWTLQYIPRCKKTHYVR
jgi:hypothetical protein